MTICSETRQLKDTVLNLQAATGVTDQTNYGNDGTYNGGMGVTDGAFLFDGTDDYILGPDNADLEPVDLTISFWFKPSDTGVSSQVLLHKTHTSQSSGYFIQWRDNGAANIIRVFLGEGPGPGWTTFDSTTVFVVGQWYYVTILAPDSSTAKIYINGEEEGSAVFGSFDYSTANALNIGRDGRTASSYFNGSLKDVRIISRAITATEIRELYNATARPDITGTVLHLRPQTGLVDQSGTQDPGSYVGGMGVVGRRYEFDDTDDYIQTDFDTVNTTDGDYTLSAWVKTNGTAGTQKIISDWVGVRSTLFRISAGNLQFYVGGGGSTLTGNVSIAFGSYVGLWTHVLATHVASTNTLTVYINGVQAGTNTYTGTAGTTGSLIRVSGPAEPFDGGMDDIRLMDSALTAAQVLTLYEGVPGFEPALPTRQIADTVLHLQANHGERDLSNHCNYGTFTGTNIEDDSTDDEFVFNGTDDKIPLQVNAYDIGIRRHATFSAWINLDAGAIASPSIMGDWVSSLGFTMRVDAGNTITFFVYPNNHRIVSVATITRGSWHHVVGVMDGADMHLYLDGVSIGTTTLGEDIGNSANVIRIGNRGDDSNWFGGMIDDVRIESSASSAAEVSLLWNKGVPRYQPFGLLGGEVLALEMSRHDVGVLNGTVLQLDGSTGVTDQSPAGNDGTYNGGMGVTAGKFVFDGTDDYLDVPNDLCVSTGFTVVARARLDGGAGTRWIFSTFSTARVYIGIIGGNAYGRVGDAAAVTSAHDMAEWSHYALTYDGAGGFEFYINGVSVGSQTGSTYTGDATGTNIGSYNEGALEFWNGLIDDVRIIQRELTATEVTTLYNNDISDDSGNGNDGTLTNGAYVGESDEIVFDGVDDYVLFSQDISPVGSRTISAWIYLNSGATSRGGVFGNRQSAGSAGWVLTANRTTPGNLTYFHAGGSVLEAAGGITTETWHHVAATYDTGTDIAEMFVDGVSIGSQGTFGAENASTFEGILGDEREGLEFAFDGSIRDPRLFNTALTAAEVALLASEYEVEVPNTKGTVLAVVPSYDDWGNATLNAIDFSGNGNVGTLTNMTTGDWVADTDSGGTRALDFDGTDDYVNVDDAGELTLASGFSISMWVYSTDNTTTHAVIAKATSVSAGEFHVIQANTDLYFRCVDNSVGAYIGIRRDAEFTTDVWHHCVFTYNGGTAYTDLEMWIDGELATVSNASSGSFVAIEDTSVDLTIGLRGAGTEFEGKIDDTYIWDRALSLDEIKALASTRNYFDCPIVVPGGVIQTQRRRLSLSGGML